MIPLLVVAQANAPLLPCGPPQEAGRLCEFVFSATGRPELARAADVLIARPLAVLLILMSAWMLRRFARRGICRVVGRVHHGDPVTGGWASPPASG